MTVDVNPDDQFHIVKRGNVVTVSLEELDDAYQRDSIADETLIWQEGFHEWMRLDMLLHKLETQDGPVAPAPPLDEDIYHVLVAPGEVKQMHLDLLADAYRLDVIDDDTLVWQNGYTEWLPISVIIGEAPENHVSIAPSVPASAVVHPPGMGNIYADLDEGSLAPATYFQPPEAPRASPWYSRTLVALAAVAAVFVSHRHGLVEDAAHHFEQEQALQKVEAHIGRPGLDTVRGFDRWYDSLSKRHGLALLSETEPVPRAEKTAKKEDAPEDAKAKSKPKNGGSADVKGKRDDKKLAKKSEDAAASAFGSRLKGEPLKKATPAAKKKPRYKKSLGFRGSSDPNDPMNGSL
jgi:hypothetical protein